MTSSNPAHKQPSSLYHLCFVELWERFGFYSVQAILVLYLIKAKNFSDIQAYSLFTAFSALIYATPIIGGYIADKLIGFRQAILLGGVLYFLGYTLIATRLDAVFNIGLALLIMGNGFFKGCVSSLVGTLYNPDDPRRDSGFTLFYMGINIGSLMAPVISSFAANAWGWGYGFATPAIGILIGLLTAYNSFKKLGDKGLPPKRPKQFLGLSPYTLFYLSLFLIGFPVIGYLMAHPYLVKSIFDLFAMLSVIAVLVLAFRYPAEQRRKMFLLIFLMFFSVIFWSIYAQSFSSLTLFLDRLADRQLFGYSIPASTYVAIEPFFIIALSPVMAALWLKLGHRSPSLPAKFGIALIFAGLSFLVLRLGILLTPPSALVSQIWIAISYLLLSLGELCLSPIGLSMITALAPSNLVGMMMGVWFLTISLGFHFGGTIAIYMSIPKTMLNLDSISNIYNHALAHFGGWTFVIGLVLLLCAPMLQRLYTQK